MADPKRRNPSIESDEDDGMDDEDAIDRRLRTRKTSRPRDLRPGRRTPASYAGVYLLVSL